VRGLSDYIPDAKLKVDTAFSPVCAIPLYIYSEVCAFRAHCKIKQVACLRFAQSCALRGGWPGLAFLRVRSCWLRRWIDIIAYYRTGLASIVPVKTLLSRWPQLRPSTITAYYVNHLLLLLPALRGWLSWRLHSP
jgi:hypothetical protein